MDNVHLETDCEPDSFYAQDLSPSEHSPLERLPVEVFTRIIFYLSILAPFGFKTKPGEDRRDWVAASQVSRWFRSIVIQDSSLWASNGTAGLGSQGLVEIISRARTMPLCISMGPFLSKDPLVDPRTLFDPFSKILEKNMAQVASLELFLPEGDIALDFLTGIGCLLTDFTLNKEISLLSEDEEPSILPGDAFNSYRPLLRTFVLHNMLPRWDSLALQTAITHLEITNDFALSLRDIRQERILRGVSLMIAALRNMPLLEVLVITNPFPKNSRFVAYTDIVFPRLMSLEVQGGNICADFLDCLSIPNVLATLPPSPPPSPPSSLSLHTHGVLNTREGLIRWLEG